MAAFDAFVSGELSKYLNLSKELGGQVAERVSIKGSGQYWYILKIIISIKPHLVMSNGERLIVKNIVRNGSL